MSVIRSVLVLGAAGAGKSSAINILSGKSEAVVGHRMLQDGTSEMKVIKDASDVSLSYIDTPGLDSSPFPLNVTEKVQSDHIHKKLLLVLVISKTCGRVTKYIKNFDKVRSDLVGNVPFLILLTKAGEIHPEDRSDFQAKYPNASIFDLSSQAQEIRTFMTDSSKFCFTQAKVSADRQLLAQTETAKVNGTASKKKNVVLQAPPAPSCLLGLPRGLSTLDRYEDLPMCNISVVEKAVKEMIAIKRDQPVIYQNNAMIGDAILKFYVLSMLFCRKIRSSPANRSANAIGNDEACAMPVFFRKYVKVAHDKAFPSEANIQSHAQANFVEALLEHARVKNNTPLFMFIWDELWEFVDSRPDAEYNAQQISVAGLSLKA